MKIYKYLIILCLIAFSTMVTAQKTVYKKNIYTSKYFKKYSANHKLVAIISFVDRYEKGKTIYLKKEKPLKIKQGKQVQQFFIDYLNELKIKKKFEISFQRIDETNRLLKQNGISDEQLRSYTIKELASILHVDAILSIDVELNQVRGETSRLLSLFESNTNRGRITIRLTDGATKKLLWKYEKIIIKKKDKKVKTLIISAIKKAMREFPY